MSSSSIPVFPLNAFSYGTDRSITNIKDLMIHLQMFEDSIEVVKSEGAAPSEVYRYNPEDRIDNRDYKLLRLNIGPVEIPIAYDDKSGIIIFQAFLSAPIIPTVLVGHGAGFLKDGVSTNVGFGSMLAGKIGVELRNDSGYLLYDFNAFGKHLQGEIRTF